MRCEVCTNRSKMASGKFLMVGKGTNYKSMAYVGNIAAFIKYHLGNTNPGYQVFNYIDKPDLNMNDLVSQVGKSLNKHIPPLTFPIGWECLAAMDLMC